MYYFMNSMSFTYFSLYSNLMTDLLLYSSLFAQNLMTTLFPIIFRQGSHFNSSHQLIALVLSEHCAKFCLPMNQIAIRIHLHQYRPSPLFLAQFIALVPLSFNLNVYSLI